MIGKELLDILVCPVCKGELEHDDAVTGLTCPQCKLRYPVEDDIPVMLPEQAEKI